MKLEKTIAFLVAETTSNEEINALSGFCEDANKEGWNVFVFNSLKNVPDNFDLTYDGGIFKLADLENFSAVVIGQNAMVNIPQVCNNIIKECREKSIPVISLGVLVDECYSVVFSNTDCIEFVVDHLVEKHGCKTINLIAGMKDNDFSEQRIDSFKSSLEKHNIPFDEKRLHYGYFWEGGAKEAFDQFVASGLEFPDAFVCCNDVMAMTICAELRKKGYKVPEDIIVTGYDGIEAEKYHSPRLTTVKCDCNVLGKLAFDYFKKIMNGENPEKQVVLEPTMVFSESCGCKNIADSPDSNYAFEVMGQFGEIRHTTNLIHHFATLASATDNIQDFKHILPEKNHFGGEYWVILNDEYTTISKDVTYNSENPFSEKMKILFDSMNPQSDELEEISKKELLPHLDEISNHGIKTIVFMNLFFKSESIGYIAVPYWGLQTKIQLMTSERLCQSLGQTFAHTRNRQKLEYLNYHDLMTGIHNRRGFYHFFTIQLEKRLNTKGRMILYSIDMDGLKYINDTFGHKEGDFAIKTLAYGLVEAGNKTLIAARFGGDEFVAVEFVEENENVDEDKFKKNLLEYLDNANNNSGKPYKIGCSIGSHSTDFPPSKDVDQIIAIADELMYSEKSKKKRSTARL